MAKVLTFGNHKGGPGKSTLAASLAVAAAEAGEGVVVIDTDPQGSLAKWFQRRHATGQDVVRVIYRAIDPEQPDFGRALGSLLASIHAYAPATVVMIDTPGSVESPRPDIAMDAADLVLLPVRPGIMDYDPVEDVARGLAVTGKPFAFVLNQVDSRRPAVVEEAVTELVPFGPVYPDLIAYRPAEVSDAMILGQGPTEYRPRGQGAEEVRRLWTWIADRMKGIS